MLVLRTSVGFENPTYTLSWERPSEKKVSDGLAAEFDVEWENACVPMAHTLQAGGACCLFADAKARENHAE